MRLAGLGLCVVLSGCAAVAPSYRDRDTPIASKALFDPEAYAGRWYEIARFPVAFQRGCVATIAEYEIVDPGTLSVRNSCRDGSVTGPLREIAGQAEITGPGRLAIRFDSVPFLRAPYWVLWTDESYRTAVVGTPSGRSGWILNRAPQIAPDRLNAALEVLRFNGYDISKLDYTQQDVE